MPFFSIITPVYNVEKYVSNAIESVLEQDYDDFEYIIVDDGSTDNSPQIIDDYAQKDSRIRVIHQSNQWIYASFNNGISASCGEYVYILNADDRLRSGSLKEMARIAKRYNPDVIWTKVLYHKCDEEQNIIEYNYNHLDELVTEDYYIKDVQGLKDNWLFLCKSWLNNNQANLYKRELMVRHPFRNDVYGADALFNLAIANDINKSYVLKKPVYDWFGYPNERNASIGKYYDYDHDMGNEIFNEIKKLFISWGVYDGEYKKYAMRKRLSLFTGALSRYKYCKSLSLEEMIDKIMLDFNDDVMREVKFEYDNQAEIERRLLFGLDELFSFFKDVEIRKYDYLKKIVDLIYKQDSLMSELKEYVDNKENGFKIGKAYLSSFDDSEVATYLKYYFKR